MTRTDGGTTTTGRLGPVVRYRASDLARLLPGTARRGMHRTEEATGRADGVHVVVGEPGSLPRSVGELRRLGDQRERA